MSLSACSAPSSARATQKCDKPPRPKTTLGSEELDGAKPFVSTLKLCILCLQVVMDTACHQAATRGGATNTTAPQKSDAAKTGGCSQDQPSIRKLTSYPIFKQVDIASSNGGQGRETSHRGQRLATAAGSAHVTGAAWATDALLKSSILTWIFSRFNICCADPDQK
jgi:hypothetical protein